MPAKRVYAEADLQIGLESHTAREQGIITQTHTVVFGRPLTQAERHLFMAVLTGFYHTVHFSHQFGEGLVAEPVVEFDAPDRARYTLKQTTAHGAWKDLLFAILANFSYEVAPILGHDDSQVFVPIAEPAAS